MSETVPAHGASHRDYTEVSEEDYVRLNQRLPAPPPPPVPAAVDDLPSQDPRYVDDLRAEVAAEEGRAGSPLPGWYSDPADPRQRRYWDGGGYVGAPVPVDEPTPADPPRDVPDGATAVRLTGANGTDIVHILDPQDWPTTANADLRVGDYESWASECLAPGDYEVWQRLAPRMRDVNAMFEEYRRLTGQDRGKSPQSMASYRRLARR